jgi:transcriptional regulator with XRE-family HTH domain
MNLKDFCKAKGTTLSKIADNLGIATSTLYAISNGDTTLDKVGISLFMRIAESLDCTTDELYSVLKNDVSIDDNTRYLTDDEITILDNYRVLSSAGKSILKSVLDGLVLSHPKNNQVFEPKAS